MSAQSGNIGLRVNQIERFGVQTAIGDLGSFASAIVHPSGCFLSTHRVSIIFFARLAVCILYARFFAVFLFAFLPLRRPVPAYIVGPEFYYTSFACLPGILGPHF